MLELFRNPAVFVIGISLLAITGMALASWLADVLEGGDRE